MSSTGPSADGAAPADGDHRGVRRHARLPMPMSVRIRPFESGRAGDEIVAPGRDVSEGGMSCRVSSPWPLGSGVLVEPLSPQGQPTGRLYGLVRRCRQIDGGWFELGLEFGPMPGATAQGPKDEAA